MSRTLLLEIVTPDRLVLRQPVESVTVPGTAGEFTVLPQHIPFLSSLLVGSLSFREEGRRNYVYIGGGFADVGPQKVLILAEVAERPEEIDLDRARRARERAAARLEARRQETVDYVRAKAALDRAIMRIRLCETVRGGPR